LGNFIKKETAVSSISAALLASTASVVLTGETDVAEIAERFVTLGGPVLASALLTNFFVDEHQTTKTTLYFVRGAVGGLLAFQIMIFAGVAPAKYDMAALMLAGTMGASIIVGDYIGGYFYPDNGSN